MKVIGTVSTLKFTSEIDDPQTRVYTMLHLLHILAGVFLSAVS